MGGVFRRKSGTFFLDPFPQFYLGVTSGNTDFLLTALHWSHFRSGCQNHCRESVNIKEVGRRCSSSLLLIIAANLHNRHLHTSASNLHSTFLRVQANMRIRSPRFFAQPSRPTYAVLFADELIYRFLKREKVQLLQQAKNGRILRLGIDTYIGKIFCSRRKSTNLF